MTYDILIVLSNEGLINLDTVTQAQAKTAYFRHLNELYYPAQAMIDPDIIEVLNEAELLDHITAANYESWERSVATMMHIMTKEQKNTVIARARRVADRKLTERVTVLEATKPVKKTRKK